jgi:hypothetical protein
VRDHGADLPQCSRRVSTALQKFFNQERQNIKLAYGAELLRDPSQASIELPSDFAIQCEEREKFAKAS